MRRRGSGPRTQSAKGAVAQSLVVVCPTPSGGHIEHATAIALSAAAQHGVRTRVLTRVGAKDYLPASVEPTVQVQEVIPSLPRSRGVLRVVEMALGLAVEHAVIALNVRSMRGDVVLLIEEPRYPVPRFLLGGRRNGSVKLVVHNAIDHPRGGGGVAEGLRRRMARACVSSDGAERIVHGRAQQEELLSRGLSSRHVPLPAPSLLISKYADDKRDPSLGSDVSDAFLCIGEFRRNKGIEHAISAAVMGGHRLVAVGRVVDQDYYETLRHKVVGTGVELRSEFVAPAEFDALVRGARAVVLPYTTFHAQSGVMSHALEVGARVLAADLPALREQAGGDPAVLFFTPSDPKALADAMATTRVRGRSQAPSSTREDDVAGAWREVVDAVLA